MSKSLIAVGSTRGPKLDAVHDALKLCASHLDPHAQFEVIGFIVDSGVGHTPLSSAESMRGARQRTEAMIRMASAKGDSFQYDGFQYFVGLEGGLEVMESNESLESKGKDSDSVGNNGRRVFLESWAYVTDGARGHFGRSGGIELPPALVHEVLDEGVELASAIDKFADHGEALVDVEGGAHAGEGQAELHQRDRHRRPHPDDHGHGIENA